MVWDVCMRFPSTTAEVSSKICLIDLTVLGACATLGVEFYLASVCENYCPKFFSLLSWIKLGLIERCVYVYVGLSVDALHTAWGRRT